MQPFPASSKAARVSAALTAALLLHACGAPVGESPTGAHSFGEPAAALRATPPSTRPGVRLSSPANQPPTVTLTGGGECHPLLRSGKVTPCSVTFKAVAVDPEGDPLSFAWSGCTQGTQPEAECVIDQPGTHRATVTVTDAHGASAGASADAQGVNRPPYAAPWGCPALLHPGEAGDCWWDGNNDIDPDGDDWGCDGPILESPCLRGGLEECGGLGDAIIVQVRPRAPGVCKVGVRLHDAWGARVEAETQTVEVVP